MIFRHSFAALSITCLCVSPVFAVQPPTTAAPSNPTPATKTILTDAEKEKDIRQLISMTGGDKVAQQVMDQMIAEMQKAMTEIPPPSGRVSAKKSI